MAILDLKPILNSATIASASYDDATGNLTFNLPTGITTEENVLLQLILAIEESAQNQRTNLNMPISQKAFPDNPAYALVNRSNADASVTELQIERVVQFNVWQVAPDLSLANAVNDND